MTKKVAVALLVTVCASLGSLAFGEVREQLEEQEAQFFGQISDSFNVDMAAKCAAFQELPEDADTRWTNETHEAIAQARSPSYLGELHCLVAHEGRQHLSKYRKRHQKTDASLLAYNIQSFVMLHGFHSVIFDKIYDLTKRGLKDFLGPDGVVSERVMKDFGYLNFSSTLAGKVARHFSDKYPPNRVILANVRAMKLYQNEELLDEVLAEVQDRYPFNDDPVFLAHAMGRIAERKVLIKFIRRSGVIYSRIHQSVVGKTEFLSKDDLQLKNSIFNERFIRFISKVKETHMNRFDPNVERFLVQLFTLKTN